MPGFSFPGFVQIFLPCEPSVLSSNLPDYSISPLHRIAIYKEGILRHSDTLALKEYKYSLFVWARQTNEQSSRIQCSECTIELCLRFAEKRNGGTF